MKSTSLLIIFLFSLTLLVGSSTSATPSKARNGSTDFITTSCNATLYPKVCVQSLSIYANAIQRNPRQLAQAALSVSLARARSAYAFVLKLSRSKGIKSRDLAAAKDCVKNIRDSTDRLKQSIRELGHVGRPGSKSFLWRMSSVQTWVSAALTDENTCADGLAEPGISSNLKAAISGRIVTVAQVTSNALALVNRFANGSS